MFLFKKKHGPPVEFMPPGVEFDSDEYPVSLTGPTLSGCLTKGFFVLAALFIAGQVFFAQRKAHQIDPTLEVPTIAVLPTELPTQTVQPTILATNEPPSITPTGTITLFPTNTATETFTVTPTSTVTDVPLGMLSTWTPGPWLLTRFVERQPHATSTFTPAVRRTVGPATTTATPRPRR